MYYIKRFELYSFPNSMIELNSWVEKFVIEKFYWWINRENLSRYNETFVIYAEDMDMVPPRDFPLSRIKIDLLFTVRKDDEWGVTGHAHDFKRKGDVDVECVMSEYKYGDLVPSMGIQIYSKSDVIEVEDIIQSLKSSIRHELTHLYELFQIKKAGHKSPWTGDISNAIINTLTLINKGVVEDFMFLAYYMTSDIERSASLSEYTIKEIPFEHRSIKSEGMIKKIMKVPKNIFINNLKSNLTKSEQDKVYNRFISSYKEQWSFRKRNKRVIRKCIDFDSFIEYLYDETMKNLPKWRKKLNKIKYQIDNG